MIDVTAILSKLIDQSPAILTVLLTGWFQWRTGKKREKRTTALAAVTEAKVDVVTQLASETHRVVNGPHVEVLRQNAALGREIARVGAGGSPTPHGQPDAENPVTLSDNVATVEKRP